MALKRSTVNFRDKTICHHCKESISVDAAVHSQKWAYGIAGVRWLVCSVTCAKSADAA